MFRTEDNMRRDVTRVPPGNQTSRKSPMVGIIGTTCPINETNPQLRKVNVDGKVCEIVTALGRPAGRGSLRCFLPKCRRKTCTCSRLRSLAVRTAGSRALLVHAPSSDIEFFAVKTINPVAEVMVVRDVINHAIVGVGSSAHVATRQREAQQSRSHQ